MNNLIITIISIALVAVATMMAIFYGGTAFENGQIDAIASAMLNEAQQTIAAQRIWAGNNNQPDATNVLFTDLVSGKELSAYPLGVTGQLGVSYAAQGMQSGFLNWNTYPGECTNFPGSMSAYMILEPFVYKNGNYVVYSFTARSGCNFGPGYQQGDWDTTNQNDAIVLIAKSINKHANIPPGSTVMTASGIPRIAAGGSNFTSSTSGGWVSPINSSNFNIAVMLDANGALQSNYCYYPIASNMYSWWLSCVFGPS